MSGGAKIYEQFYGVAEDDIMSERASPRQSANAWLGMAASDPGCFKTFLVFFHPGRRSIMIVCYGWISIIIEYWQPSECCGPDFAGLSGDLDE